MRWKSENFTLLEVTFSKKLTDMVVINFQLKLNEINNLLIQWSNRIVSSIGKNRVIKTLALSKINHLIISLHIPNIKKNAKHVLHGEGVPIRFVNN